MAERNLRLVSWEAQYPLEGLKMSTEDGILWENRGQASEAYFNDYSWDWEDNLALLTDVKALASKYGDYIMIAYPIVQNFVADTYYRNPDPMVQDKGGNRDLSRMLTDVFKSVHRDSNSEQKMQHGFQDQSWAGFGLVYATLKQKVWEIDGELVPEWQRIIVKTISPWKVRFDPRGREWDLSDHAYISLLLTPKLSQVMSWGWVNDDDRRRVIAWNRSGMRDDGAHLDSYHAQRIDYPLMADNEETDPDIIDLPMWVHFDRTKKLVYYRPAGSRFTLTPQPWPEEFAAADEFPVVYMAKNREPENKRGTTGFIGVPDLRLIKPHLLAIRRLESQFLAANQNAIFKYLSPKGALEQAQQDKLQNDVQKQVIEYDPTNLEAFPTVMRDGFTVKDILQLVPQPDLQETRHLVGIQHEFDMIAQILGQASGDRGGMPATETATDSMIVNERLNKRLSSLRHEAGKHYMRLTKLIFLILKQRQVLPIAYQMTTTYNEQVWAKFSADKLRELDLHFEYAIGSGEARTREKEFELRERMAAILMPVLTARQDIRGMMKVARDLVEVLDIKGSEQYFNDEVHDAAMQLGSVMTALARNEASPADPRVMKQIMQLLGKLLNELLTPQDLAALSAERAGKAPPEPTGAGTSPKALTAGEQAYASGAANSGAAGSAQAGAIGGMS